MYKQTPDFRHKRNIRLRLLYGTFRPYDVRSVKTELRTYSLKTKLKTYFFDL